MMMALARRAMGLVRRRPECLLEMIWPEVRLAEPPPILVPEGYRIRHYESADAQEHERLFAVAGEAPCPMDYWEKHLLPDGFFVIEHAASKTLVASCFASHRPSPRHPRAGNLGWLVADPAHRGRKLGQAATAAVTARLIAAGYRRIYLETQDFRLAAINIYLRMGWLPLLYQQDMRERWSVVSEKLGWPVRPGEWVAA